MDDSCEGSYRRWHTVRHGCCLCRGRATPLALRRQVSPSQIRLCFACQITDLQRSGCSYMTSMVMLCTLSWVSFALKDTYIEARLASTITLVLAMMALSQVITPSLPQSGEQTPAHLFMFRSNVFIVLVGIESVLVNALGNDHHKQAKAKKTIEDPERVDDDAAQGSGEAIKAQGPRRQLAAIGKHTRDFCALHVNRDLSALIDIAATIVFPLSFVWMTMSTFAQLPFYSFAVCFPLIFGALLLVVQMIMGSTTLYDMSLMQACAPTDDDGRTTYVPGPYHEVRGPRARAAPVPESAAEENPATEEVNLDGQPSFETFENPVTDDGNQAKFD